MWLFVFVLALNCRSTLPFQGVSLIARNENVFRSSCRLGVSVTTSSKNVANVNEASKKMGGPLSGLTDSVSAVAFAALHAFDDCGVEDAAKNLRVLWVRALLANSGILEDDIAFHLLPASTRFVVSEGMVGAWKGLIPFCDWIFKRTEYIDSILETFSGFQRTHEQATAKQVVIIGAGYDTRSLRWQQDGLNFFEVDLPEVLSGKQRLHAKYKEQLGKEGDALQLPKMVGLDLNEAINVDLLKLLEAQGLRVDQPTMFVFEAVLFYLEPEAVEAITGSIFQWAQKAEAEGAAGAEAVITFTDSLKGMGVTKPFLPDVKSVFEPLGFEMLTHRSQWGGAVHFTSMVRRLKEGVVLKDGGGLRNHMVSILGEPLNSYAPQFALQSAELMKKPSFRSSWYAIGLTKEIPSSGQPYATRLWGEPIVLFRDKDDNLVCLRDLCPHRAAPLSLGEVSDGQLKCFYHGWAFGKDGACEEVPTMHTGADSKFLQGSCATNYACVERAGMVYVWGGNTLEADPRLLPQSKKGEETLYVDTRLDYNVDWTYIVENNLDSPHIYWLHDGSIPPLDSLGFNRDNVDRFSLRKFKDAIGVGHVGKTSDKSTTKIVRFDAPNIVRHCGVSGFSEEFHIIPLSPNRCRVLLRQHFPKGPILSMVASNTLLLFGFQKLMEWWNYIIALEDYSVMQGQAHNIEDLGAPHLNRPGLGDDLIADFYSWRQAALKAEGNPYFMQWGNRDSATTKTGQSSGDERIWNSKLQSPTDHTNPNYEVHDDGTEVGTYGLKRNYFQMSPAPTEPPVNSARVRNVIDAYENAKKAVQGVMALAALSFIGSSYPTLVTAVTWANDASSVSVSGMTP